MASPQAFITYWMLRLLIKPQIARRSGRQSLDDQRRGYERAAQRWGKLVPGARVESITIGTLGAERVVPPQAKPDRALLWFFGGGYRSGSPATERSLASRIAGPIQAHALLPAYRLCPENPLDASLEDALIAYRWLRDQVGSADRVIVGGVSAGGGLALRLLCALRDQGEELPAAAAVISPATDLAGTGASIRTNARSEAIFPPGAFAGMRQGLTGVSDLRDPRFSPMRISPAYRPCSSMSQVPRPSATMACASRTGRGRQAST